MCDAIRIAHPQIASDAKKFFFSLAMWKPISLIWNHRKSQKYLLRKSCDAGLRCKKSACFLRSSDAKCLRFGLPLRFGLRCGHPQCQIASDVGRAMRTTKYETKYRQFCANLARNLRQICATPPSRMTLLEISISLTFSSPDNTHTHTLHPLN